MLQCAGLQPSDSSLQDAVGAQQAHVGSLKRGGTAIRLKFAAKGKAKNLCWGALTQAIILTVTTVGLTVYAKNNEWTPQQVVLAMAGAISGATVCVIALPYLFFCATSVGIAMNKLVRPLWPIIIPTAVMGIVVAAWRAALADFAAPWLKLALSAGLGIAVYAYLLKDQLRLAYQEWFFPKKV